MLWNGFLINSQAQSNANNGFFGLNVAPPSPYMQPENPTQPPGFPYQQFGTLPHAPRYPQENTSVNQAWAINRQNQGLRNFRMHYTAPWIAIFNRLTKKSLMDSVKQYADNQKNVITEHAASATYIIVTVVEAPQLDDGENILVMYEHTGLSDLIEKVLQIRQQYNTNQDAVQLSEIVIIRDFVSDIQGECAEEDKKELSTPYLTYPHTRSFLSALICSSTGRRVVIAPEGLTKLIKSQTTGSLTALGKLTDTSVLGEMLGGLKVKDDLHQAKTKIINSITRLKAKDADNACYEHFLNLIKNYPIDPQDKVGAGVNKLKTFFLPDLV